MSGGLAISTPNGPANFAGAKYLASLDSTSIQPFVGYIWNRDRFYLHGFSAIDTPAHSGWRPCSITIGRWLFPREEH